jgi:general secretion pathway protein A
VLKERRARGQITALVIDEAQSMSGVLLEEIRLLANTETPTEKLLPVVLAGQPELTDRLNEPGLRQLKQRVTLRCTIEPFSVQETAAYIAHRIRMAGGDAAKIFTREAVMLIHERSSGIPRIISVICDNSLLTGFALGRQTLDSSVVLEVAHDFDLGARRGALDFVSSADAEAVDPPRSADVIVEPADDASDHDTTIIERLPLVPQETSESAVSRERELFVESRRPSRFSIFGRHNEGQRAKS